MLYSIYSAHSNLLVGLFALSRRLAMGLYAQRQNPLSRLLLYTTTLKNQLFSVVLPPCFYKIKPPKKYLGGWSLQTIQHEIAHFIQYIQCTPTKSVGDIFRHLWRVLNRFVCPATEPLPRLLLYTTTLKNQLFSVVLPPCF